MFAYIKLLISLYISTSANSYKFCQFCFFLVDWSSLPLCLSLFSLWNAGCAEVQAYVMSRTYHYAIHKSIILPAITPLGKDWLVQYLLLFPPFEINTRISQYTAVNHQKVYTFFIVIELNYKKSAHKTF